MSLATDKINLERQILEALGEESILLRDLVWMLLQLRHPLRPDWIKQAYQNGWYPIREDALMFFEIAAIEETVKHLVNHDVLQMEHGYVQVKQ